jgi:hypothetical protein
MIPAPQWSQRNARLNDDVNDPIRGAVNTFMRLNALTSSAK